MSNSEKRRLEKRRRFVRKHCPSAWFRRLTLSASFLGIEEWHRDSEYTCRRERESPHSPQSRCMWLSSPHVLTKRHPGHTWPRRRYLCDFTSLVIYNLRRQDHSAARRIAYHSPGLSILSIHYTSLEASLSDKIRTNGLAMTHTAVRVMSSTPLTFYV